MAPFSRDTSPEAAEMLIEAYRQMTPQEKLRRVLDLNATVETLAIAGIRSRHGADLSERELRLRLASLYYDRELLIEAFGWDPEIEGYEQPEGIWSETDLTPLPTGGSSQHRPPHRRRTSSKR